jgi:hypothetical protein
LIPDSETTTDAFGLVVIHDTAFEEDVAIFTDHPQSG